MSDVRLNKTSDLTVLEWHPSRKVIACGLECGDIVVYDLMNSLDSLAALVHTDALVVMLWTFHGTQLVTADKVSQPFTCSEIILVVDVSKNFSFTIVGVMCCWLQ